MLANSDPGADLGVCSQPCPLGPDRRGLCLCGWHRFLEAEGEDSLISFGTRGSPALPRGSQETKESHAGAGRPPCSSSPR